MPLPSPVFAQTKPKPPAPCILDLSRSFSRATRVTGTGIDRVERAYWAELIRREAPLWAIVRHGRNYALLDRDAGDGLMRRLCRTLPGEVRFGQAAPRLHSALRRRRAAAYLRRRSTYFGSMAGLMVLLSARFGQGFEYLNVGHCNLDDIFLRQLKSAGAAPVRIKLHDMIPLDFPDLVRVGMPALFRSRARAAMVCADQIICNSAHTAARVAHHAAGRSVQPEIVIAHLGVSVPERSPRRFSHEPYFVCVGTIEPRKNHALLFEVWQRLVLRGGPVPRLYLVGARGWRNEDVFRLLDSSPLMGRHITECAALPDKEMFALMSGASALLFPSHEEGFGLPALEARALGVQVICSPIPALRELLQDDAMMLETDDPQRWADAVLARASVHAAESLPDPNARHAPRIPTWEQHFAKVFGPETVDFGQAAQGALTSVRTV